MISAFEMMIVFFVFGIVLLGISIYFWVKSICGWHEGQWIDRQIAIPCFIGSLVFIIPYFINLFL